MHFVLALVPDTYFKFFTGIIYREKKKQTAKRYM